VATVPIFGPDGLLHDVPPEQVKTALAQGGEMAFDVRGPDGLLHSIPESRFGEALRAGGIPAGAKVPVPQELQGPVPQPQPNQARLSQMADRVRNWIGQQRPVPAPGEGIDSSSVFGVAAQSMNRPLTEIGNMGNQLLQSIYDILPPNVANEIYKKRAGLPNRLAEIAPEAVMTVGPLALGAEERPYTPGTAAEQAAPRPAPATAESASPGAAGTVARHLPIIGKYIRAADMLGDLVDTIKGKPPAPPTPAPPSVPPYWGKQVGRDIGPPSEWGQPNPPSAAGINPGANVPRQDVIAANPGEQARLAAVGSRMTQPLQLPTQNRGLALPAGQPEPLPEPAPMPQGASTVPRTLQGESALNQVLTGLDNKTLLQIARSRGINVSAEAQLKPGVADNRIIQKIVNDFSPDELADVRGQYLEISRMRSPWEGLGPEPWRVRVLQQFFPDVRIPAAALKRADAARAAAAPGNLVNALTRRTGGQ